MKGASVVEAVAAVALVALVMTASFGILVRAEALDERSQEALERVRTAKVAMERAIASPFSELATHRNGPALVRVDSIGSGLKRVRVRIDGRTVLETRVADRR